MLVLPVIGPPHSPSLFQGACSSCPAEDVCGGDPSSPCGCLRTGAAKHRCQDCPLVCREGTEDPAQSYDDEFRIRLREGISLDQLSLSQPAPPETPPLLIPLRTRNLTEADGARLTYAATNLEGLLSLSSNGSRVRLRKRLTGTSSALRRSLKVSDSARILAVLNGKDEVLEGMWPFSARSRLVSALSAMSVLGVTGPTYSVYELDPASHRTYMAMRHHKMVQEIDSAGLLPIPNLYWREGDERDIALWGDFLNANPQIRWITRDFSRDKHAATFDVHLDGLVRVLRRAGREFHVFALTGPVFGNKAVRRLAEVGCTCSIVTARPVLAGLKGRALIERGGRVEERILSGTLSGSSLAVENLSRVENLLLKTAFRAGVSAQPTLLRQGSLV